MGSARRILLVLTAVLAVACGGNCAGFWPDLAEDCRVHGKCGRRTYASGDALARTYVRDSADCLQSEACTLHGRCSYDPDVDKEHCVALTDAECRQSEDCRTEGACAIDERGQCRAEPTGCQRSEACTEQGRCVYEAGACVEGPIDCAQACRMEGACDRIDELCVATTEADCASSHFCSYGGQCHLSEDRCTASPEACATSWWCEKNGTCTHTGGDGCYDGVDVCATTCWSGGRCDFIDGHCQTADPTDCTTSVECVVLGRCDPAPIHCYNGSDASCASSLECRAFGRCTSHAGTCVDKTLPREAWFSHHAGCLSKAACWDEGACLSGPDKECMTAEQAGLEPWLPPPYPGNRLPSWP